VRYFHIIFKIKKNKTEKTKLIFYDGQYQSCASHSTKLYNPTPKYGVEKAKYESGRKTGQKGKTLSTLGFTFPAVCAIIAM